MYFVVEISILFLLDYGCDPCVFFLALSLFSALDVGEPPVDSLYFRLTEVRRMDEEWQRWSYGSRRKHTPPSHRDCEWCEAEWPVMQRGEALVPMCGRTCLPVIVLWPGVMVRNWVVQ
jgi:hypothetical protein